MFGQQAGLRLPTEITRYYEGALWSSYYFADGAALSGTEQDLFSDKVGSQGGNFPNPLSLGETNLPESGRIANGLAFTVRQIALEPRYADNWPMPRAEIANIQKNCVVRWFFLNSFIDVAPGSLIGQGGGIFGSTADTGAACGVGGSRTVLNSGAGQTWIYHELPVLLPAGQSFTVKYRWGTQATVVDGGRNDSALILRTLLIGIATSALAEG